MSKLEYAREDAAKNAYALQLLQLAKSSKAKSTSEIYTKIFHLYTDLARAISGQYQSFNDERQDLYQVACIGLLKAIYRFDTDAGENIVAFAAPTIHGEIKQHLRNTSWVIRPPRRVQELSLALRTVNNELALSLGRSPSPNEISKFTGCSKELIREAAMCSRGRNVLSIDKQLTSSDETNVSFVETLVSTSDDFEQVDLSLTIEAATASLPNEQKQILQMRFEEDKTQTEIAVALGVSQMHVSRSIKKALETLRNCDVLQSFCPITHNC